VAGWLGFDAATIQAGLDTVKLVAHRLVPLQHANLPLFVIDDCYNSNPASALAAIDTAVALARPGDRLILVLGDMLELGQSTEEAHREVGQAIRRRAPGVGLVVAVGESSRLTAETARAGGIPVEWVADAEAAATLAAPLVRDGQPSTILVKGSRGIALERVVERLIAA
jgi:UDP-N-acetylmuramoyl-tripeptide--D-alanyl-D-alanine ligase